MLAAVRALNRVELVTETMRHALDALATAAPDFLRDWINIHVEPEQIPGWSWKYSRRVEEGRLNVKEDKRQAAVEAIGRDGRQLLSAIYAPETSLWLREIPAVDTLRRVWMQNFYQMNTEIHWRDAQNIASSRQFISSPLDTDAHLAKKGSTCWVGYKVHLTETCEDDQPNLITHVETTTAPASDGEATPLIHKALQGKNLLPDKHIVDTGFLDAELMVTSKRDFQVDLLGPTRPDVKWQSQEGKGFDAAHFHVDWQEQKAICPEGRTSMSWTPTIDQRQNHLIKIKFSSTDCGTCPSRVSCVRSQKKYCRRTITLRQQDHHEALYAARNRAKTPEFRKEYARRAGIEGTLSRAVRRCDLRRSPYVGQVKGQRSKCIWGIF